MPQWLFRGLFFVVALCLLALLHRYVWIRLVRDPELPAPVQRLAERALGLLYLLLLLCLVVARLVPTAPLRAVLLFGLSWLGTLLLTVSLLAVADVLTLIVRGVGRVWPQMAPTDPSRRSALARLVAGAVGLVGSGLVVVSVRSGLARVAVKRLRQSP